jgi:hypothetical protein
MTGEARMKTVIVNVCKSALVLASTFAPFLVVFGVLATHPHRAYLERNFTDLLSWIWLMFLAAMMLGLYYWTVYLIIHAFNHARTASSRNA